MPNENQRRATKRSTFGIAIACGCVIASTCGLAARPVLGAGTAWELVGSTAGEKPAAARPVADPAAGGSDVAAAPNETAATKTHADEAPQPADARWTTFCKLDRALSVEWKDMPLADAFEFLRVQAGVDMMVMWIDEDNPTIGLRRERTISLSVERQGLIDVLEKVLERADTRAKGDGSTWQISDTGTLQVGPRERLNKWTRTYAYDMADLLMASHDMMDPDDALLTHGIQSTQPVNRSTNLLHRRLAAGMHDERPYPERAEELRQVIMATCEPKAWIDNGGDAAVILLHTVSKAFVVRAPDYVHRAIDGYHPTLKGRARVYEHEATTPLPQASRPATVAPAQSK